MANSHRAVLIGILKLADLAIVATAFAIALCAALPGERVVHLLEMQIKVGRLLATCGYLAYWHLILVSLGLYRSHRLAPVSREWRDVLYAVALGAAPVAFAAQPFGLTAAGSQFLAAFVPVTGVGAVIERRRVLA